MKLNEIVEKTYLINMEKRQDRLALSSIQLKNNNIEYEVFPAIDGSKIYNDTFMNNGQYGNYLSHLGILEKCVEQGIKTIAIFEDDVEFCEGFGSKFEQWFSLIPENWDMVYLGHNRIAGIDIPTGHPEIVKIIGAYAIHAFMLNEKAIHAAYEYLKNNKVISDVYYADLQHSMNAYGFSQQLCSQTPDWSDIDGKFVDHRWIFGWN